MIERRLLGELTTYETRNESNDTVNKQLRYQQIASILMNNELTAKEIAVEMYKKGYVPTPERNFSSPRLNELMNMGVVEVIGKKICEYTGKRVSVYKYNGKQSTIFDYL